MLVDVIDRMTTLFFPAYVILTGQLTGTLNTGEQLFISVQEGVEVKFVQGKVSRTNEHEIWSEVNLILDFKERKGYMMYQNEESDLSGVVTIFAPHMLVN